MLKIYDSMVKEILGQDQNFDFYLTEAGKNRANWRQITTTGEIMSSMVGDIFIETAYFLVRYDAGTPWQTSQQPMLWVKDSNGQIINNAAIYNKYTLTPTEATARGTTPGDVWDNDTNSFIIEKNTLTEIIFKKDANWRGAGWNIIRGTFWDKPFFKYEPLTNDKYDFGLHTGSQFATAMGGTDVYNLDSHIPIFWCTSPGPDPVGVSCSQTFPVPLGDYKYVKYGWDYYILIPENFAASNFYFLKYRTTTAGYSYQTMGGARGFCKLGTQNTKMIMSVVTAGMNTQSVYLDAINYMGSVAPTPIFACEQPLNGYEVDQFGNRRLSVACNPPCVSTGYVCEQPLNGYERDNCGDRRLNTACNPLPVLSQIVLIPSQSSIIVGQELVITAHALDTNNLPMSGVPIIWSDPTGHLNINPVNTATFTDGTVSTTIKGISVGTIQLQAISGIITSTAIIDINYNNPISPCGIIGDVDMDGSITQADVNLARSLIGSPDLTIDQIKRIDVNGNGLADTQDVQMLQDFVDGKIITFPACKTVQFSIGDLAPIGLAAAAILALLSKKR